ncbi:MAG: AAA domain-containing protein [Acidimicrobiales bacterium]
MSFDPLRHRRLGIRFDPPAEGPTAPGAPSDATLVPVVRVVKTGPLMTVEIAEPTHLTAGRLVAGDDSEATWQEVLELLTDQVRPGLADAVMTATFDPAPEPSSGTSELTEEQRRVVAAVLGDGLQGVWSLPGTGRTTAIAEAVAKALRSGDSMLLTSNDDQALDDILKQLTATNTIDTGTVVRIGPAQSDDLIDHPDLSLSSLVAQFRRPLQQRLDEIEAELGELDRDPVQTEWAEVSAILDRCGVDHMLAAQRRLANRHRAELVRAELERLTRMVDQLAETEDAARSRLETAEGDLEVPAADLWRRIDAEARLDDEAAAQTELRRQDARASRRSLDLAVQRMQAIPGYRLVEKRRANAEIETEQTELDRREARWLEADAAFSVSHAAYLDRRAELEARLPHDRGSSWWQDVTRRQDSAREELDRCRTTRVELDGAIDRAQEALRAAELEPPTEADIELMETIAPQLPALRQRQAELDTDYRDQQARRSDLRAERTELEAAVEGAVARIINGAKVIVLPVAAIPRIPAVHSRRFDVVVVDEVTDIDLSLLVLTATLADRGVTLFTDPTRPDPSLEPRPGRFSVSSDGLSDDAWRWLATSPAEHFGLRELAEEDDRPGFVYLSRQFHYGPTVEVLLNHTVAGQRLWTDRAASAPFDDGAGEVVVVDTDTLRREHDRPGAEGADVRCALAVALMIRLAELHRDRSVALVADDPRQARRLETVVADLDLAPRVRAGTPLGLGGERFDVVVVDAEPDLGPAETPPADGDSPDAGGDRGDAGARLAAALTLATGRVYLVGPADTDTIRPLVDQADDGATSTVDAADLVDDQRISRHRPPVGTTPGGLLKLVAVHPKAECYHRLEALVAESQSRVDVLSPSVGLRRVRTLGSAWLRAARRTTVAATIRPPRTEDAQAGLEALEQMGVEVETRPTLARRLVVVDGRSVLWGSVDALAANRTSTIMVEIESPGLAELLLTGH